MGGEWLQGCGCAVQNSTGMDLIFLSILFHFLPLQTSKCLRKRWVYTIFVARPDLPFLTAIWERKIFYTNYFIATVFLRNVAEHSLLSSFAPSKHCMILDVQNKEQLLTPQCGPRAVLSAVACGWQVAPMAPAAPVAVMVLMALMAPHSTAISALLLSLLSRMSHSLLQNPSPALCLHSDRSTQDLSPRARYLVLQFNFNLIEWELPFMKSTI